MAGKSDIGTQRAPAVVVLEEHNALGLRPVHARPNPGSSADDEPGRATGGRNVTRIERPARSSCGTSLSTESATAPGRQPACNSARGSTVTADEGANQPGGCPACAGRARGGRHTTRHQRADRRQRHRTSTRAPRERRQPALSPIPSRSPATRAGVGPGCVRPIGVKRPPGPLPRFIETSPLGQHVGPRRQDRPQAGLDLLRAVIVGEHVGTHPSDGVEHIGCQLMTVRPIRQGSSQCGSCRA